MPDEWIIAKFGAAGESIWRRSYEGEPLIYHHDPYDQPSALVLDEAENVYVAGFLKTQAFYFKSGYSVLKHDRDGNRLWRASVPASGGAYNYLPSQLLIDSGGRLYLAGRAGVGARGKHVLAAIERNGTVSLAPEILSQTPPGLRLDGSNHLLVASTSGTTNWDFLVTKYRTERGEDEPSILSILQDQEVLEGGEVRMSAEVKADAPAVFQWLHDGFEIPGATNATLRIGQATPENRGVYALRVGFDGGTLLSSEAVLTMATLARFDGSAQQKNALLGGRASLTGSAHSTAPIQYAWLHNGQTIPNATNDILELTGLQAGDAGVYTTEAVTPSGRSTRDHKVRVFAEARESFRVPLGGTATGVAADRSGNILVAVPGRGISKFRPDGAVLWKHPLPEGALLTVDLAGNIFAASSSAMLKIDAEGAVEWSRTNAPQWQTGLWHFNSHLLLNAWSGTNAVLQSFDAASGELLWSRTLMPLGYSLETNAAGILVCGGEGGGLLLQQLSSEGAILWESRVDRSDNWPAAPCKVLCDAEAIYAAANDELEGAVLWKFSSGGEPLWKRVIGETWRVIDAEFAGDGTIVLAGGAGLPANHRFELKKLSPEGQALWTTATHRGWGTQPMGDLFVLPDGGLLVVEMFGMAKWDANGVMRWRLDEFSGAFCIGSDALYAAGRMNDPNPALIRIEEPPVRELPLHRLEDRTVAVGERVEFALDPAETSGLAFSWTMNGQTISGATNRSLVIEQARSADTGAYGVVLSDSSGARAWPSAWLEVMEKVRLETVWVETPSSLAIRYTGVPGFVYEIQSSADLRNWTLHQGIRASAEINEYSVPLEQSPARFFRIVRK